MTKTEQYGRLMSEYFARMEYPSMPRLLYDPIRYTMEDGGKRLRPLFVLAATGLWAKDVSVALPAAAAVEMFHNFTLMHDDIMDNAPLRRGRESVYRRWNPNVATLSGDALMILSYRQLALSPPELLSQLLELFNEAAVKVCEGQQLDMDLEETVNVKPEEHLEMVELKTAALFVGAVSMGALIGGAGRADVERLREFALQFGIVFQIQDDLLDTYGDTRLGKTVGGDILAGKQTWLKTYVMAAANATDRAELALIHKDLCYSPEEKIARVLDIYERYGVRNATESEISRRFDITTKALDGLSAKVYRVAEFKEFAMSQLYRTK